MSRSFSPSGLSPREKILALADGLIRKKGYNAFSYKDISAEMEVRNAAIHYYFPTKEALGASVLGTEIRGFEASRVQWQVMSPKAQLKALFAIFAGHARQGNVCLVGSLSPGYDALPPEVQANLHLLSREILDWLTGVLKTGRAKQQFRFDGEAADRALIVVSGLMSSLLLARVHGIATAERVQAQLLKDILVHESD